MILDKENEFSDAQAVTGDAASDNIIDQGAAGDALGGSELYLVVSVDTTFDSAGGAATLIVKLQCDDNSGFSSAKDLYISPTIDEATLVAGYEAVKVKIPVGAERYLRVYYDNGTEVFTAGKINAFLTQVPSVQP